VCVFMAIFYHRCACDRLHRRGRAHWSVWSI